MYITSNFKESFLSHVEELHEINKRPFNEYTRMSWYTILCDQFRSLVHNRLLLEMIIDYLSIYIINTSNSSHQEEADYYLNLLEARVLYLKDSPSSLL